MSTSSQSSPRQKNSYLGVYDIKESNTFRPTIESRIHIDSKISETLTTRNDSCCVIMEKKDED